MCIRDSTIGLRVSEEEEIVGLDKLEHGLESAYAGFAMDVSFDPRHNMLPSKDVYKRQIQYNITSCNRST